MFAHVHIINLHNHLHGSLCMYFFMGLGSDWQMCPFACEQGSIVMLWNDVECINLICQPPLAICPIISCKNLAIWRDSLPGQKQSYSKMRWECCTCSSLIESSIPMDYHQFSQIFPIERQFIGDKHIPGTPKIRRRYRRTMIPWAPGYGGDEEELRRPAGRELMIHAGQKVGKKTGELI